MKMNRLYKLGAVVAATFMLSSCDDFLSEDVRGSENLDTYFQTADEVNAFVGGCYFDIDRGGSWWEVQWMWLENDATTDDLWDGNTTQEDDLQKVTHFQASAPDQGNGIRNFWRARYIGIRNCNVALERIANSPVDENLKKQRIAEVRFLRAYYYFELVRNYGGVPLVVSQNQDVTGLSRSSIEDCYAFIESELELAAQDLKQRSELAAADMGRATRGAALGILGKAQIYQGKYTEAKTTLKTIIDDGEYQLLPNFGDVWNADFNNSVESLFETQHMYSDEVNLMGGSLTVVTGCRNGVGDGWAWGTPTSDLENAFIAAGDTERLRWTIIKTMCSEIAGETQFSTFVRNNQDLCKVTDAKYLEYMDKFGWTVLDYNSKYIIDPAQHKSARIIRKYFLPINQRPEVYNTDRSPLNHRILRYADVLLLYAEACNETNDDSQARWALNQVRNRVHLPEVTAGGDELRQAIRLERRLELAYEQNRLFDIRRWDDTNGKKVMCNLFGPNGSFVKYNTGPDADMYEAWNQIEPSNKGINFREDRDLLYPIPREDIQRSNGAIVQNPGWN